MRQVPLRRVKRWLVILVKTASSECGGKGKGKGKGKEKERKKLRKKNVKKLNFGKSKKIIFWKFKKKLYFFSQFFESKKKKKKDVEVFCLMRCPQQLATLRQKRMLQLNQDSDTM